MNDTRTDAERADDAEHVKVLGQADALIRAVFAPAPGLPPAELAELAARVNAAMRACWRPSNSRHICSFWRACP